MKKRLWILTAGIILLNIILVHSLRSTLPETLPLHISPDGSYAETMPYTRLYLYPVASLLLAALIYLLSYAAYKLFPSINDSKGIRKTLVHAVVLGLALIILCSTCVALTMGRAHIFMYAEPFILLLVILTIIVGEAKVKKNRVQK